MADADLIINTSINNQGINIGVRQATRELERLTRTFETQYMSIRRQEAAVNDLRRQYAALSTLERVPASLTAMETQQRRITAEIATQRAAYDELISRLRTANEQLTFARGVGRPEEIAAAVAEVQRLDAESLEYADTLEALEERSAALARTIAQIRLDPTTSTEAQALAERISVADEALARARDSANATRERMNELLSIRDSGTGEAIERTANASARLKTAINTVLSVVKKLGGIIRGAFSKIGGFVGKAIGQFKLFGKEANKTTGTFERFGKRIKSLIVSALVFSVLYKAMRELTAQFGNVLMANEQFASSLNAIKVNLLTAFAPIWQTIEPAIISFMNVLAQATAILAQFMAMIFGQTIQQAKASAEALNKQSKALTGVGKAGEKAGVGIQKFDDLNQAMQETASEGGGVEAPALDFAAVEPPELTWLETFKNKLLEITPDLDYFYGLGEKLAEAINKGLDYLVGLDWPQIEKIANGIGQKLGAFLSGAIENINWGNIGTIIGNGLNTALSFLEGLFDTLPWAAMGKSLADLLNNLINTAQWKKWGETLGKGINGVLKGLNKFFREFDWANLGSSLAEGLQGLTDTIDWSLLGRTLGNGVNGLLTTIYTFFTTYDWLGLGTSIASSLNTAISTIDWALLGATLASIVQSAIDAAYGFVTTFDYSNFGTSIGEAINSFFAEIDWAKAGETISTGIIGALSAIGSAIRKIEWYQIGKDIQDFLVGIDWGGMASELARTIGNALAGLALLIWGLVEDAFNEVVGFFATEIENQGYNIVVGLLTGIVKALAGLAVWLWDNVFKPFIDGFMEMFDMHSPSKVMEGLGVNIMKGLMNGIISLIDNVVKLFGDIWQGIQDIFTGVAQWFDDTVVQPIINFFSPIVKSISDFFQNTWDEIVKIFTGVGTWFGDNVITPITGAFQGIVDFITNIFTGNWDKAWQGVTDAFNTVFGGISDIAKGVINGVIDLINGMISAIINGVNFMIDAINSLKIDIPDFVPGIGGQSFGFNVPRVSAPQIPRLATGAVLPPNKPFMAMLGDQTSGRNLEAPEGLIRQIMQEEIQKSNAELANMIGMSVAANLAATGGMGGGEVNLYMDTDLVARATFDASQREQGRRGINLRPIAGVL